MDIERTLLKAGVTIAAMFAIYQGTQGVQKFAKQRSADARTEAEAQQSEKQEGADDYIESLRIKEAERRLGETASFKSVETRPNVSNLGER